MARYFTYKLVDPRNNEVRSVGYTNNPRERLISHLTPTALKGNSERSRWLRELQTVGLKPKMEIIEQYNHCPYDEEAYWIKFYLDAGHRLTNIRKVKGSRQ